METALCILILVVLAFILTRINQKCAKTSSELEEVNWRLGRIESVIEQIQKARAEKTALNVAEKEEIPEIENKHVGIRPLPPPPPPPPFIPANIAQVAPDSVMEKEFDNPVSVQPERKFSDLEKLVGENLFGKIGILALIIGIGFFVKFAIDNDWINETGRTIVGMLAGLTLWGVAYPLRNKYHTFSSILAGGGFAVCFVTTAISYNFYALMSSSLTFVIFLILSALMVIVSLKFERRELALVAIAGAFVAPFLSVGESQSCLMLFAYIAVIDAAMFIVTVRKGWWEISVADCLLSWIVTAIYVFGQALTSAESGEILGFATLFLILFSIPLAMELSHNSKRTLLFFALLGSSIINGVAYIVCALHVIDTIPVICHVRGLVPFLASVVFGVVFFKFYRGAADRLLQSLLLWMIIAFSALVIPVQFSTPSVITVGLAIYMLAIVLCFVLSRRMLFLVAAAVMTLIDCIVLLDTNSVSIYGSESFASSWTFGLSACCYIGAGALFNRFRDSLLRSRIIRKSTWRCVYCSYLWIGVAMACEAAYLCIGRMVGPMEAMSAAMDIAMAAMLVVSILARSSGYFGWLFPAVGVVLFVSWCGAGREVTPVNEIFQWTGAAMYVMMLTIQGKRIFNHGRLSGIIGSDNFPVYFSICASVFTITALELLLRSVGLSRYYSAGFSVGLIVCGAALMAAGMRYRMKSLRLLSLLTFGFLLVKLCLYDVWGLPVLGRIVVFVLLGIVLLVISFFYQKLRKYLFDGK